MLSSPDLEIRTRVGVRAAVGADQAKAAIRADEVLTQ